MNSINVLSRPDQSSISPLWDLLRISMLGETSGDRFAVPSAGALFPYDFDIGVVGINCTEDHESVTLQTLEARLGALAKQMPISLAITVQYRPHVSTQKYGERGIIYGLLDCGHILANFELAAQCLGLSCILTQFPFVTTFDGEAPLPARVPVFHLKIGLNATDREPIGGDQEKVRILDAMTLRASARSFSTRSCSDTAISRTLALTEELCQAVALSTSACAFRLAQRQGGDDWSLSKADSLIGLSPALSQPWETPTASLFCGQGFTEQASAILVVSMPLGTRQNVVKQSIDVGKLGQVLYLSAGMHQLAACCVGGFHYAEVCKYFDLPNGHYAAYAMLFGLNGPDRVKVDRQSQPSPRDAIIPFPSYSRSEPDANA